MDGPRNTLLWSGWFNQGFQPVLGVAAATAKLIGLDVRQTRMALRQRGLGHGGVLKNRGSDTKSFTAGSAAMHGVMAAELVGFGFTANEDIIDGDDGVAPAGLGREVGDAGESARRARLVGHGDAGFDHAPACVVRRRALGPGRLQQLLRQHPTDPDDIESIEVHLPAFLMPMLPYHQPQTGLEAKYSIEYDMATIALDGRAGLHQYSDEAVNRPPPRTCSRGSATCRSRATCARSSSRARSWSR